MGGAEASRTLKNLKILKIFSASESAERESDSDKISLEKSLLTSPDFFRTPSLPSQTEVINSVFPNPKKQKNALFSPKLLRMSKKNATFAPDIQKQTTAYMKKTVFGILLALGFAACAGPKQLAYWQDLQNGETLSAAPLPAYLLQPGDQLTIRVSSFDHSAVAPFNIQDAQLRDIPYIINDAGLLAFPGIGTIPAEGKTIAEITTLLQDHIATMAKGAVVRVELVSAFVTVIGEVKAPTRIKLCPPGLTLAEAITDAGDLRPNASRIVTVLRKQKDGTQTFTVDLTKKESLTSPAWQLLPGDVVYVAPRRGRLIY